MRASRLAAAVAVVLVTTACSAGLPAVLSPTPRTAEQVMHDLAGKVPSAKLGVVYTAADDPNHLLGRPSGYTSKVSFTDSRVDPGLLQGQRPDAIDAGGSVEVYPDADGAAARQKYILGLQKAAPILGVEYSYLDGPVLVRVSGKLTPDQAAQYQAALGG